MVEVISANLARSTNLWIKQVGTCKLTVSEIAAGVKPLSLLLTVLSNPGLGNTEGAGDSVGKVLRGLPRFKPGRDNPVAQH